MREIHRSDSRGLTQWDWLESHHSFSFGDYYNTERIHFGALRVLNDDRIKGGGGFQKHPHKNMEIITLVLQGNLKHKDSLGNEFLISPYEVQVMSAGSGLYHSEFNASIDSKLELLQIWILPEKKNIQPRYEQKSFQHLQKNNHWILLTSPDGRENSLSINQNAFFSLSHLQKNEELSYSKYDQDNGIYLFIIEGEVELQDIVLKKRDGVGIENEEALKFIALDRSQILLMEIPMKI